MYFLTSLSRKWLGFLLLLLAGAASTYASEASLFDLGDRYFESFDELESLSADIVMDIRQDSHGFIWLATQKGLLRYDGYEFKPYTVDETDLQSISGNYIQSIVFAGGKMWVGTYSDGVSIYDPDNDNFSRLQHDPDDAQSLVNNDIRSMVGNDDSVVIATRSGINLFSLERGVLRRVEDVAGCEFLLEKGKLTSLAIDARHLFIGSSYGLCKVDVSGQALLQPRWMGDIVPSFEGQRVFNLDLLRDGELWVSTRNNGIGVLSTTTGAVDWVKVDAAAPEQLNSAWVDQTALIQGDVWAATVGAGVAIIDPDTLEVQEHIVHQASNLSGLALNDVSAIFEDDAGIVWLGTWGSGMNRFNPANRAFKILRQNPYDAASLGDSHIQSAKEMRNGDLWLGTALSGVQVMRPGVGLIKSYGASPGVPGALQNPFIHSIEQLANGEIWVGTNQTGVYRYNAATDNFTQFTTKQGLPDDLVRTLYGSGEGTLWLGTDSGLARFDAVSGTFETARLAETGEALDKVVGTIASHDGHLWVGTNNGLFVVPKGETDLRPVTLDPRAPLSDNYIADLTVDSAGRLWVATAQGLDILRSWDGQQASFVSVNEKLGLGPQSLGEALEEDSLGRIWAQSHLIDPNEWSYTRIERNAGWDVGNTWIGSNAKLRDGTIIFGGTRGLIMVRPEQFQRRDYPARIAITRGTVDSVVLTPAQMSPLVLDADIKSFTLEFATLSYAVSQQVEYRYRLEGYDDGWITTSPRNRRATYSRLAPGDYRLKVTVGSGDGPSESMLTVPITQLPRWYETAWFRTTAVLLGLVMLYVLYRVRVRHLYRQRRALDLLVEQRTENIRQLAQAGQEITSSLDLEHVVTSIRRHAAEFMDTDVFAVGLLDEKNGSVNGVFHYQNGERIAGFQRRLSDDRSPAVWCIKNRQILSASSAQELGEVSSKFSLIKRAQAVNSLLFHPLVIEDKAVGFLSLQSYREAAYGENERQMLQTIASYAAVAIDNAESHSQLTAAKAQIERVSVTDQLTGLSNRRFLESLLPSEMNRLKRLLAEGSAERLGIILVDADHFKQVNDTYGHSAGDEVLIQLAEILRSTCREMDWAIRFGGEEFLVLARVSSDEQLLGLAERIRQNVASFEFKVSNNVTLSRTCSMGICQFPFMAETFGAVTWEQSLNIADQALYMAKEEGRNRWVAVFENNINDASGFYESLMCDFGKMTAEGEVVAVRSSDGSWRQPLLSTA